MTNKQGKTLGKRNPRCVWSNSNIGFLLGVVLRFFAPKRCFQIRSYSSLKVAYWNSSAFFWNLYIHEPCEISTFAHQVWESSEKSGWVSHNFSNWKGLYLGVAIVSIHNCTGQWSELDFGRMFASIEGPSSIKVSETRKRSSVQEICWEPNRLLDQVKVPFLVSISIRLRWYIRSLNLPLSWSSRCVPPLFSFSVRMMLKSLPIIQCYCPISPQRNERLCRNRSFFWLFWGP